MKPNRRRARSVALQFLYQLDFLRNATVDEESLRAFLSEQNQLDEKSKDFCRILIEGVHGNKTELDSAIVSASQNWRLDRMPAVDRNILRMGVFELRYCDDIPNTVTLNEMVELAKEFGSEESASFVNGVLDQVSHKLPFNPSKAL